jgi:iron complex outermembrane receptor protein
MPHHHAGHPSPATATAARRRDASRVAVAAALSAALTPAMALAQQQPSAKAVALEEVVVTARKRSETVQTVPLTIDVLSGQDLAAANKVKLDDLQFEVPGFYVENYETRATIALRGVGAQVPGNGAAVATHLNGIYQASTASSLNFLFDVDRVEVLKGPQGTLYGRNSTAGAINIITREPGKSGDLSASLDYGSYNTRRAEVGADVALGGDWAMRLAGSAVRSDGRLTNQFDGEKVGDNGFTGGRVTLVGQIGGVKVELFAQDTDETGGTAQLIPVSNGQPMLGWNQTYMDLPTSPQIERKYFMSGLTLSGELGNGYSWRSVTGYLDYYEPKSFIDVNPLPSQPVEVSIKFPQYAWQQSEELAVLYTGDRLNWVFGGLYMTERDG